jgi:Lon protease-like protein
MSDALDRVRAAAKRLKVFPLPSAVLLPGGAMPLHIFEPRYRQMMADALETDGVFAMAQVIPGQEQLAVPALESMVCVGVVSQHELTDDGRYNVVLVGVARARVLRELPQSNGYREVEAEVMPDSSFDGPEETQLRQAVLELVARLPQDVGQRIAQVTARAKGGMLADVVAAAIFDDAIQRYEILSELDVSTRVQVVTEELLLLVGQLRPRKPEGLMN